MGLISYPNTLTSNQVPTAAQWNQNWTTIYNEFNGGIDNDNIAADANIASSKLAATLTGKTLNTARVDTALLDTNGNEVIKTPAAASAVNELTVINSATGSPVQLQSSGGDTDIDLELLGKGAGMIKADATYGDVESVSVVAGTPNTVTLNLALSNKFLVSSPSADFTFAVSNSKVGKEFSVGISQGATARAITYFGTITWMTGDGSAPTAPIANKTLWVNFRCVSTGQYHGFIEGFNG